MLREQPLVGLRRLVSRVDDHVEMFDDFRCFTVRGPIKNNNFLPKNLPLGDVRY